MEPLFTTQTRYNFYEHKRFIRAVHRRNIVQIYVVYLLVALFFAALGAVCWYYGAKPVACLFFIGIVLAPLGMHRGRIYGSWKHFEKSEVQEPIEYSFFEDHLEVKTSSVWNKIEYASIHSIIETDTNFYIMMSVNQGMTIIKKNCSADMVDFISQLKDSKNKE